MQKQLAAVAASVSVVLTANLAAHGGQYRGPGEVVPPSAGSSSNSGSSRSSKGSGSIGAASSGSADTRGPSGPAPTGASSGPARGSLVGDDLTRWAFWWEINKDRFINLQQALFTASTAPDPDPLDPSLKRKTLTPVELRPSRDTVIREVLPALRQALQSTENRDVVTACLIAIAKIGADHPGFKTLPLLSQHLRSADQEVRETAALALGITQMANALPTLLDLLTDSARGRELVARSEVDIRTRTFAAYGAGLVGYRASTALQRVAFEQLRGVLATTTDRNLKIGVIQALRLLQPDAGGGDSARELRNEVLDALWSYYVADQGLGEQQVQAHVPAAIATLLGRGGDPAGKYKALLLTQMQETQGKRNIVMIESAILALGQLCTQDASDAAYVKALVDYADRGRDQQARYFALIALGQIGGDDCRTALLDQLRKGKDQERSWSALALGVLAHDTMQRAGRGAVPDKRIGSALLEAIQAEHNPEVLTALAVGIGLSKHGDAGDTLRQLLEKYRSDDERAGYLAIGLALMGDQSSRDVLHEILASSTRRPDLIRQCAVALGKLGDHAAAGTLAKMLQEPDRNVAKLAALAGALGLIGDRHSLAPLRTLLFDPTLTDLSRAFVAAALGGIGDKEPLPWNAKIGADVNYRAAVETLTNQVSGILDIL